MKRKIATIIAPAVVAIWAAASLVAQDVQPNNVPDKNVRIYKLLNADAAALADLLKPFVKGNVAADARSNQLIVNADKENLEATANLIKALDVPAVRPVNRPYTTPGAAALPAAGAVVPRYPIDDVVEDLRKSEEEKAEKVKGLADQLAAARAIAVDKGGDAAKEVARLGELLGAARTEHADIESKLKLLTDGAAGFGGGGGFGGAFGGGGARAGVNQFGAAGGGGGGFGGFAGGGGGAGGGGQPGAVQFQFGQAGGGAGQGQIEINQDGKVTRFIVPANGLPAAITTTTVKQRQAEQAINNLAAQLQSLKKIELLSDAQKAQMDDLKAQLMEKLDEQFKETQKAQFDELAQLRDRLDNLQKEITDRNKNREEILDQRLEDILSGKAPMPAMPAAAARRVGAAAVKAVPQGIIPAVNPPAATVPADPFNPLPAGAPVAPAVPPAEPK